MSTMAPHDYFERVVIPHPNFEVLAFAIPSETPVRGNAMASDDDAFDREVEDRILAALNGGDWRAWFDVVVVARFDYGPGFIEASEYLGACSYSESDKDALLQAVTDHGLEKEAVLALKEKLADLKAALAEAGV